MESSPPLQPSRRGRKPLGERIIVCSVCREEKPFYSKGKCLACYHRDYQRRRPKKHEPKEEPWFLAWLRRQVMTYLRSNELTSCVNPDGVKFWILTESALVELCRIVCLARSIHEKQPGSRCPARRRGGPRVLKEDDGEDGAYLDRDVSPSLRKLAK